MKYIANGINHYGLEKKYPVNRPLKAEEINLRLFTWKSATAQPDHERSIIKMNSTYLELCDKFFKQKGFATILSLANMSLAIAFAVFFGMVFVELCFFKSIPRYQDRLWLFGLAAAAICAGAGWCAVFWYRVLRTEIFRYTHYPMRFNRKTRMVHVFRLDGTVMSESWDKLFFTVAEAGGGYWDIMAHRLAEDGETVLETFSLPFYTNPKMKATAANMYGQWEFVRRYMEEGPEELVGQVDYVLNIERQRESIGRSWENSCTGHMLATIVTLPITIISFIGRCIAMPTCKIPQWPQEIEEQCRIEPDDPYVIYAETLPDVGILGMADAYPEERGDE
jgi:hypothetical protein